MLVHVNIIIYIYLQIGKFPEGQVYVPRLEPTAPIRLADRNHAHYPSRRSVVCWKSVIEPSFIEDGAMAGWIVRMISIC